jgi:hypothetical protein
MSDSTGTSDPSQPRIADAPRSADTSRGPHASRGPDTPRASGSPSATSAGDGREETPLERVDRNFEELTGELRVVVTGVQVLFAFLLIVPFDTGFAHVGSFERAVYFVTLIFAALAAMCTIAPSARHRFVFRNYDKERLVVVSNRMVIVGLCFLALAMCGCLLLVATKLFGVLTGALTAIVVGIPFAALWFAMPLRRRAVLNRERRGGGRS